MLFFTERRKKREGRSNSSSASYSSSLPAVMSTQQVQAIVDRLSTERYPDGTQKMYHHIWKLFNQFFICLDSKPRSWGDRLILFTGFLVNNELQSSTVKTYVLAIRGVLREVGMKLAENNFLITSLTKACRLKNDIVLNRFPILKGMLKLMIDQIGSMYGGSQTYLSLLYAAIYSTTYYGLLRIGEVAKSPHTILACNTHIRSNKNKILFILLTSKTHGLGDKLQKVKIGSKPLHNNKTVGKTKYCPLQCFKIT